MILHPPPPPPPFQVNDIHMLRIDITWILITTLAYIPVFKIFKSDTQFHSGSSFQCDWSAKINSALHSCGFQFQEKISKHYPNIFTPLKMFGTIPLSCCSCERYASTLRRLSTFLLCTQREQLSALALILRFQSMKIMFVSHFSVKKRLKFISILLLVP